MVKIAICPNCSEELMEDECYDTDFGSDYIRNFISGHCPECEKEFQWIEIYEFIEAEEIEEVT